MMTTLIVRFLLLGCVFMMEGYNIGEIILNYHEFNLIY